MRTLDAKLLLALGLIASTGLSPVRRCIVSAESTSILSERSSRTGSVRSELANLEREQGLSMAALTSDGLQFLVFESDKIEVADTPPLAGAWPLLISPDGSQLALSSGHLKVMRRDGSGAREYSNIEREKGFGDICWSHDGSKLALGAANLALKPASYALLVVSLATADASNVDAKGVVTSQCWSPDDKQIVYSIRSHGGQEPGTIWVYDTVDRSSRSLTLGDSPTWSPDGKWIAFRNGDAYFTVNPLGKSEKMLFKRREPSTGLLWSPDQRFVAYYSKIGFLEGGWHTWEAGGLRIRRLEDDAEYSSSFGFSGEAEWMLDPKFKGSR